MLNKQHPFTLDFAAKCISSICPNNEVIWYFGGPGHHFSKLAEEVAEVHEAISGFIKGTKRVHAVADEIADVLAWMLGAWSIIYQAKSFDEEMTNYCFQGCLSAQSV